jgi:hypothetical protein
MPPNLTYRFHHWILQGTAWLDNYRELGDQATTYQYDWLDNLTHVIDTAGNTTDMTTTG